MQTILATFDLQITLIFPTKFRVNFPFGSEVQIRSSRWGPWWSFKFRVNWPFSSGKGQNRIDFQADGYLGLQIRINLAIFDLQVALYPPSFKSTGFWFRRRSSKLIFKMVAS